MEKTYCKICDTELHPEIKICPDCGIEKIKNKKKSSAVAALLSCIVPGLGQVYAGDSFRGFAMLAALGISLCLMAFLIGFFTFVGTWIFAVIDAYKMVKRQNYEIEKEISKVPV